MQTVNKHDTGLNTIVLWIDCLQYDNDFKIIISSNVL